MKIQIKPQLEPVPVAVPEITREYLDSQNGSINRYNIKVMPDGRQFVIHCITGFVLERKNCKPVQDRRGNIMWVLTHENLSALDRPVLQQWKNPERASL